MTEINSPTHQESKCLQSDEKEICQLDEKQIWTPLRLNFSEMSPNYDVGFYKKYEVSNQGVVRNRLTKKVCKSTNPQNSDTHGGVRVSLSINGCQGRIKKQSRRDPGLL